MAVDVAGEEPDEGEDDVDDGDDGVEVEAAVGDGGEVAVGAVDGELARNMNVLGVGITARHEGPRGKHTQWRRQSRRRSW